MNRPSLPDQLEVKRLGRIAYEVAREQQLELAQRRAADEIPDTLLLCEHEEVFTLGRGTSAESLPKDENTKIVEIERGGDITWHGPGQIVGYWIRKLEGAERDLHKHLRLIEDALIATCAHYDLDAGRNPGKTGVWVSGKKLVSIGVAVKKWVTFHGFALNVKVDPTIYQRFRPCGLDGLIMSDLETACGTAIDLDELEETISSAFQALVY